MFHGLQAPRILSHDFCPGRLPDRPLTAPWGRYSSGVSSRVKRDFPMPINITS